MSDEPEVPETPSESLESLEPTPSVDRFEWIRRGDGTEILHQNGQVCGDVDTIATQRALRRAGE